MRIPNFVLLKEEPAEVVTVKFTVLAPLLSELHAVVQSELVNGQMMEADRSRNGSRGPVAQMPVRDSAATTVPHVGRVAFVVETGFGSDSDAQIVDALSNPHLSNVSI